MRAAPNERGAIVLAIYEGTLGDNAVAIKKLNPIEMKNKARIYDIRAFQLRLVRFTKIKEILMNNKKIMRNRSVIVMMRGVRFELTNPYENGP